MTISLLTADNITSTVYAQNTNLKSTNDLVTLSARIGDIHS
jgi:hypothetical protein